MDKKREEAKAVPAATILLVRDGLGAAPSLEVFMVVRHHQIDFASGALVFPGGKTSKRDYEGDIRHLSDGAESLSDEELGIRICAIREAFEETGVLLAREGESGRMVTAERVSNLDDYRPKLDRDEISFAEFLETNDLRAGVDLLCPFAHWITPKMMPKRFDTYFYLAKAPSDHAASHDGGETVDSIWRNPGDLLQEADEGKWTIIFPTKMNLEKLSRSANVSEALGAAQSDSVVTVEPQLGELDGRPILRIPEEAGYSVTTEYLDNIPADVKGKK